MTGADDPRDPHHHAESDHSPARRSEHGHERHHSHGHGHGHGHGLEGGWERWRTHPALRLILAGIVIIGAATVAGLFLLWPDGSGRQRATEQASFYGLASERWSATVESVTDANCNYQGDGPEAICRTVVVFLHDGPDAGSLLSLPPFDLAQPGVGTSVAVGDALIVGREPTNGYYFFADRDRRSALGWLAAAFAAVVVLLGRKRGALALAGMVVTVVILIGFVTPSVLDGNNPLLVCLIAASAVAFASLYLTHGFNPTTTVALAGTLGALVLTLGVSWVAFSAMQFSGLASDEGLTLPIVAGDIDLVGLLLGGAMIGALGALDDVTVTQVATVAELKRQSPRMRTPELITSGITVGREHIASTVNTLLLAYAGASMPLLLLFAVSDQSLEMVANSEAVAVEIARTLCGSIGLVAATPLTTVLAAVLVGRGMPEGDELAPAPLLAADEGTAATIEPGSPQRSEPDRTTRVAADTPDAPSPAAAQQLPPSWDDFAPDERPSF